MYRLATHLGHKGFLLSPGGILLSKPRRVDSPAGGKSAMMISDYLIDEVSGTEYQTLEQLQQGIFMQLARFIADAIRQNHPREKLGAGELRDGSKCDTIALRIPPGGIEPKELLEVNDDV